MSLVSLNEAEKVYVIHGVEVSVNVTNVYFIRLKMITDVAFVV